jgi:hypothetical protein
MMPIDFHKALLIAVDPGLRGSGLAIFRNGVMQHAEYVKNSDELGRGPTSHMLMAACIVKAVRRILPYPPQDTHFLVEFPRIYPGPGAGIDHNDLLDVAGVASATMHAMATSLRLHPANCRFVLPFDWKGNIKKKIMTQRILDSLTDAERGVIVSSGEKDHNTVDAAGLGLWQLGRLNRRVLQ